MPFNIQVTLSTTTPNAQLAQALSWETGISCLSPLTLLTTVRDSLRPNAFRRLESQVSLAHHAQAATYRFEDESLDCLVCVQPTAAVAARPCKLQNKGLNWIIARLHR
jgi:hypothetical protein